MIETRTSLTADGTMVIERVQDCTPIADLAKELHNTQTFGDKEMKLAGIIPNVMIEQYCNLNGITYEEWAQNKEHKKRLLNDPAMKAFRVWGGRL